MYLDKSQFAKGETEASSLLPPLPSPGPWHCTLGSQPPGTPHPAPRSSSENLSSSRSGREPGQPTAGTSKGIYKYSCRRKNRLFSSLSQPCLTPTPGSPAQASTLGAELQPPTPGTLTGKQWREAADGASVSPVSPTSFALLSSFQGTEKKRGASLGGADKILNPEVRIIDLSKSGIRSQKPGIFLPSLREHVGFLPCIKALGFGRGPRQTVQTWPGQSGGLPRGGDMS